MFPAPDPVLTARPGAGFLVSFPESGLSGILCRQVDRRGQSPQNRTIAGLLVSGCCSAFSIISSYCRARRPTDRRI